MSDDPYRGMVYVHVEKGYKGTQDMLEEALSKWKPGRRTNEDLTHYKYPAVGGVPQ